MYLHACPTPALPPLLQTTAAARSRVLGVLEEELDQRHSVLPFPYQAQEAVPARRLYNANLVGPELSLAKDLLRKLGAIDAAREVAETVSVPAGEPAQVLAKLGCCHCSFRPVAAAAS